MSESEQCTDGSAGICDMSGCRSRREKETEVVPLCVLHTSPSPSNSPAASMCASIGASIGACLCLPVQLPGCLPLPGNQPLLLLPAPHAPGKPAPSFLFRDSTTTK